MPKLKPEEKRRARELRAEGMPYKRIAAALSVSPASAFAWTRDIQVTSEQAARNYGYMRDPALIAARVATWRSVNRQRRLGFQQEGRKRARAGDALHEAGCMLYWAEGSKGRNAVQLANSDAHLLRFFTGFLRGCFGLADDAFVLSLNVYTTNDLTIEEIEAYWQNLLDLPPDCWRKHQLNYFPTSSSGRKVNRLPYGVCKLATHSTRIVQHIYGAIQEYGGFEEPRWLE